MIRAVFFSRKLTRLLPGDWLFLFFMKTSVLPVCGFLTLLFSGCEKAISFNLEEKAPKLVVEATIENDRPPVVILTHSLNYFGTIDPDSLQNSFVRNAEVFVSNGTAEHQLKEYSQAFGNGYTGYYYSIDSSNLTTAFLGTLDHAYTLRVEWQGKEYLASTTIPAITKQIDSVWWKPAPEGVDTSKVALMIRATDPPGYGDYVRYFTKRNDEPFYPGLNSVFDDQVIDGSTYELEVERGVCRSVDHEDDYSYFDRGDTVTLKLCNIDRATYDFWRTMEFSYSSIGNPFSSPTKVLGNIEGGALGYFGGYAAQFRTIIIPE
jgi:Domain of unknown function (DUF4249)